MGAICKLSRKRGTIRRGLHGVLRAEIWWRGRSNKSLAKMRPLSNENDQVADNKVVGVVHPFQPLRKPVAEETV